MEELCDFEEAREIKESDAATVRFSGYNAHVIFINPSQHRTADTLTHQRKLF